MVVSYVAERVNGRRADPDGLTADRFTEAGLLGRGAAVDVRSWLAERQADNAYEVTRIPFKELRGWHVDPATGNLRHDTGKFLTVEGMRVRSELAHLSCSAGARATFAVGLTLFVVRTRASTDTARLSAMTQTFGYLIAAGGPFLVGAVHDLAGGWTAPLLLLIALLAPQLVVGLLAGRSSSAAWAGDRHNPGAC